MDETRPIIQRACPRIMGRSKRKWHPADEPEDPQFHACEDFDNDGNYDEAEYFGDFGDRGYYTWFDSEQIVKSVVWISRIIILENRTSDEAFEWRDECTSLEGSEVTLTWRFISNGDGINGNAGLAGFAIDNIRFEEFTFEDDGNYSVEVNGLTPKRVK